MKLFQIFTLAFVLVFAKNVYSQTAKIESAEFVELEIEIPIMISDQCQIGEDFLGTVQILCAYSLGGKLPAGGKIIGAHLTTDSYFETEYWFDGDKLMFEFLDRYDANKQGFYSEVFNRYRSFPVILKFVYQGPKIELDQKILGNPVDPH